MQAFKDPETQKRARVERERKAGLINCKILHRRRRCEGELPTPKMAIQNHCRECMGFSADDMPSLSAAVGACTAIECWLYPWRRGTLDESA